MTPISAADIAAYQRDGAVLLKGALPCGKLALLEAGLEEANHARGAMSTIVQNGSGKGETLVEQFPSQRSASLKQLLADDFIGSIAGQMLGAPSAQLILDQIFYKQAGEIVPTPWHQDTVFLQVRGNDMLRVWLTCDHSPRAITVQVVRGSHRWNVVYDTRGEGAADIGAVEDGEDFTFDGMGDAALPPIPDIENNRDSFDIMSWDVEPGDILIFNGNMLHGTDGAAWHDTPRRAFTTRWGGPDLRYHNPPGGSAMPTPAGSAPADKAATIPNGTPIGQLAHLFPIGWRAQPEEALA